MLEAAYSGRYYSPKQFPGRCVERTDGEPLGNARRFGLVVEFNNIRVMETIHALAGRIIEAGGTYSDDVQRLKA